MCRPVFVRIVLRVWASPKSSNSFSSFCCCVVVVVVVGSFGLGVYGL